MRFLPALRGGSRYQATMGKTIEGIVPAFRTPEQKAIFTAYADRLYTHGSQYGFSDWTVEKAVSTAFTRVVWVFKSVNTIATHSAALPAVELDEKRQEVLGSPVARLLHKGTQANPLETGQQLRKRISALVLLSPKGVFVETVYGNGGQPVRYDILPTARCQIIPDDDPSSDALIKCLRVTRPRGEGTYDIPWGERVLWFRDPHPTDPFMGITPLEAAGMSVELDFFARLYNISFMRNDGRPGGVVAVKGTGEKEGDVDPATLATIEAMFAKGPGNAGKIAAITGEVSYVDFGATPRDAQYDKTSQNSKTEILASFGVPETVMGYAGEKTYANADAEERVYWTITMPGHNSIIETAFSTQTEDGHEIWLDTSGVQAVQNVEAARRQEAREEFSAGLRSPFSYAEIAGIEGIESTPFTRALYLPTGKTPLAANDADAAALGMAPAEGAGGVPPADGSAPPPQSPGEAVEAITSGAGPESGTPEAPADPAAAVAAIMSTKSARPRAGRRRRFRVVRDADDAESARESNHPTDVTARLEEALAEALQQVVNNAVNRGRARLSGVKARRGTRHWTPEYEVDTRVGRKALDAARAMDPESVEADTSESVKDAITLAAAAAAAALLADAGIPESSGLAVVIAAAAASVIGWLSATIGELMLGLVASVNRADQDGLDMPSVLSVLETERTSLLTRVRRIAGDAAHSTVEAARDAAAGWISGVDRPAVEPVTAPLVRRVWTSRQDERVRPSHRVAHGQEVGPTVPFLVGGTLLKFPRDPSGPLRETAGCRCWVRYLFLDRTGEPVPSSANMRV